MINTLYSLIIIECRILFREIHEWLYPIIFFCMTLILFPLAFTTDVGLLQRLAPGCIWIATLFSSLLSIQHFFISDLQSGFLQESFFATISMTTQIMAKFIAHWLMHIIPLLFLSFFIAPLFHLTSATCLIIAVSLLLGTPILMLISMFASALTIGLRQQGMLMSMLILPLIIPVMIFSINIVAQANAHISILGPLMFLAGIAILSITLLPFTISIALKLSIQ